MKAERSPRIPTSYFTDGQEDWAQALIDEDLAQHNEDEIYFPVVRYKTLGKKRRIHPTTISNATETTDLEIEEMNQVVIVGIERHGEIFFQRQNNSIHGHEGDIPDCGLTPAQIHKLPSSEIGTNGHQNLEKARKRKKGAAKKRKLAGTRQESRFIPRKSKAA